MESISEVWSRIVSDINLDEKLSKAIYNEILSKYNESHRHYHTITHIEDMLTILKPYESLFIDSIIVYLSVLFHDIIYDPKSSHNEEDSAQFFMTLFQHYLDASKLQLVIGYILQTKLHQVTESLDNDLKLFIDADMSILGRSRSIYHHYAKAIRLEYSHVSDDIYCTKRSEFLWSCIQNITPIYASLIFQNQYESQARANISWEYELLVKHQLDIILSVS